MSSVFEWLSMGGYSAYVWPAYGLVSLVLLGVLFSVKAQKKRTQKKLQHWFKS